ncbi:hypothetical protein C5610_05865 [Idiomarina sp. OT37-5b]|uniref:DUF4365 domain-containing protein n=1 Tax=Idiomarina sp. OT37-5b TaxID=2100422 RepID=UPI000CF90398|nr:DUF4365 domain-containing protein [Idiomarina sp. OT37-5b]AVJ55881.1 hypothetical protein C5610_05865 [Idiomarina sp. OT37-5b]
MDFPKRIKQHKAESDSYAILLYKLRDLGIFRNLTDNDYGVDFEIELVDGATVTGKYVKAQVKSSENLTIRKADSVPTVGGIKQSTLNYWAELSYKTHVIAYVVDLETENIYISKPLFWQAISLMDASNKTKTIEFVPHDEKHHSIIPSLFTKIYAHSPSLMDEIYCHKMALKNLKQFFDLYADVFHYDFHMPVNELDVLESFLEVCRVLLWSSRMDHKDLTEEEKEYIYSFSYWRNVTEQAGGEDVANYVAQKPLKALMPHLLDVLRQYESRVFSSKYYWKHKSPTYLKLVYDFPIPKASDHEAIRDLGYGQYQRSRNDGGFSYLISKC